MLEFEKYKKIGSDIIKDITNTTKDVANVTKDQYGKIKEDFDYEKKIREKKEKLDSLDDMLYQKFEEIRLEHDYLEMLKGKVNVVKEAIAETRIPEKEFNEKLNQIDENFITSQTVRKHFPDSVKKEVLRKQDYGCNICHNLLNVVDYDHIDGNRSNNDITNCQALCPNCHAEKTRREQIRK